MKDLFGYLFIIIGVADFLLGNFAQINLTYFLGSLSTFSPYVFGGIGFIILNYTGGSQSGYDPELDERFSGDPKPKKSKSIYILMTFALGIKFIIMFYVIFNFSNYSSAKIHS